MFFFILSCCGAGALLTALGLQYKRNNFTRRRGLRKLRYKTVPRYQDIDPTLW